MKVKAGLYTYIRNYAGETIEVEVKKYADTWWCTAYFLVPSEVVGYSKYGEAAFSSPVKTKKEAIAFMNDRIRAAESRARYRQYAEGV